MNRNSYKKGLRDGIPIALGYFAVSFTLGIAAKKAGFTAFQATLMSLTNSTSAGEFAAISAICAGSTYLEMAVMQVVINLRYLLMSCALSQKIDTKVGTLHRLIMGGGVTDEIFGISVSAPDKLNPFYMYGAMSIAIPAWAFGTCLGAILGSVLPANMISALSIALYGMFLAVIIPPARDNKIIALLVVLSMAASYLFSVAPALKGISSGMRVIILTVVISMTAAFLFPIEEDNADAE
ncbi:MAG: AzlC family ABC transporter permease [Clostridium sp.]|nr:AzlC family ABC transporter permease [Clostridium sp.]MCM1172948.1 AzlC family ABC transporter permease [Clostridium sp.]MCM1208858.1 AzlC family ABC transporter permease [Ruminococcus sp.]